MLIIYIARCEIRFRALDVPSHKNRLVVIGRHILCRNPWQQSPNMQTHEGSGLPARSHVAPTFTVHSYQSSPIFRNVGFGIGHYLKITLMRTLTGDNVLKVSMWAQRDRAQPPVETL